MCRRIGNVRARDDRRSMFVNIIYYISRFQHGKVQILQYREGPRALLGREGGREGNGRGGGRKAGKVSIAQKGEATHVKGDVPCGIRGCCVRIKTESEPRIRV